MVSYLWLRIALDAPPSSASIDFSPLRPRRTAEPKRNAAQDDGIIWASERRGSTCRFHRRAERVFHRMYHWLPFNCTKAYNWKLLVHMISLVLHIKHRHFGHATWNNVMLSISLAAPWDIPSSHGPTSGLSLFVGVRIQLRVA